MKRILYTDDTRNDYKRTKIAIGSSDMASLVMRAGSRVELLHFNIDEDYSAWYVDNLDVEIPEHYDLVFSTDHWLKIYDDMECVYSESGRIDVYRAGDMGCVIRRVDKPE